MEGDGQFLFSPADERRDGFGGFVDIGRDFGKGRDYALVTLTMIKTFILMT